MTGTYSLQRRILKRVATTVLLIGFMGGIYGCNWVNSQSNGSNNSEEATSQPSDGTMPKPWIFTDVTSAAGFNYSHGYIAVQADLLGEFQMIAGGVAAGDFDGDGWVDLYAVRGDIGPNLLFRNRGDGTFEEIGAQAGVDLTGTMGSGPIFADYDGDGWLDLLVGGINGTPPSLFHNNGDGTFTDVTPGSGLLGLEDSLGASFGDYDLDGDLDLFVSH